jgi:hypothetical protein
MSGFDVVAEQTVVELEFFGQEHGGGRDAIRRLLERMW